MLYLTAFSNRGYFQRRLYSAGKTSYAPWKGLYMQFFFRRLKNGDTSGNNLCSSLQSLWCQFPTQDPHWVVALWVTTCKLEYLEQ